MQAIDRLGWAEGVSFLAQGSRFGIRVSDGMILEQIVPRLPPGWKPSSVPIVEDLFSVIVGGQGEDQRLRRFHLLYAGPERLVRTLEQEKMLAVLEKVLHFHVAIRARRRWFVEAGVVGWRGRTIVLPGRNPVGKTSLVAALVRAGASYFSDTYAVFDEQGRVHPYPKPLTWRPQPDQPAHRLFVHDLGGRVSTGPLPLGSVVVTQYQFGRHWRPRPLSLGQAILALFSNAVLARFQPESTLRVLQSAVVGSSSWKGCRGEADEAAHSLLRVLENN